MDGIEIYDASGKLQFNGNMLTYTARLTGTAYVEARRVGNTSPNSLMIPTTQTYPTALVALGGGGGYVAAYAGVWNATGQRIFATNAPVNTAFNYYIFEKSNAIPATSFGVEVRNAQNEITFSSSQRVMRCLNLIGSSVGVSSASYPGRQLAFAQGAWAGHRISGPLQASGGGGTGPVGPDMPDDGTGGGGGQTSYTWRNDAKVYGGFIADGGQTVSGEEISWDDVTAGPTPDPTQPPDFDTPLSLFVIDVTGIPIGAAFF